MNIAVFSTKKYEKLFLEAANQQHQHSFHFIELPLNEQTAPFAKGAEAVCVFVNDFVNEKVIALLAEAGVKLVALRCAGYNNVDLAAARKSGIAVVRVPAYSPHSVAEHPLRSS